MVVATPPPGIARFLAQPSGLSAQQDRCVRLLHDAGKGQRDAGQDQTDPGRPPPAQVLGHEATDDGTEDYKC